MELLFDGGKCAACGTCVEVCPKKPEGVKISDFINCPCDDRPCIKACKRKAIGEINGIIVINRARCDSCGDCMRACPNHAIARGKSGKVVKCDHCYEEGRPKCVMSCPYNALAYEMDANERENFREWVGWEKAGDYEYEVKAKSLGYEESKIINDVLGAFRQNCSEYDEATVREIIGAYCEKNGLSVEDRLLAEIVGNIRNEITGYGILERMLEDDDLEEIAVIGQGKPIYVYHKGKGWMRTNIMINSQQRIIDMANKMSRELGRRITLQRPRLNANISLGRVHASMQPIAQSGACLTIRKFRKSPFTCEELVENNTISREAMNFLSMAMQSDLSLMVAGNTGSGKTTLMNALFSFIPENDRVIIVEETPEINVPQQHSIKLATSDDLGVGMHQLIEDTLRMRPDRVIVGEIRTPDELKAFINTMLAGQGKASYATFHAQNAQEALIRMRSMGIGAMDLNALDLIATQKRWGTNKGKGEIRRVTEICAVKKNYGSLPGIAPLFEYSRKKDRLEMRRMDKGLMERLGLSHGIGAEGVMRAIRDD